ncbi:MAG: TIGR04283 family arsenosugar biosynthesis glycosyltransferase [Blastocatellia bacterium]|jgi:rSAM/selenodomain-associated transferase 2
MGRTPIIKKSRLSIIIPTLEEEAAIRSLAESLRALLTPQPGSEESEVEILLADGGSKDGTVPKARALGWKVIESPQRGRGPQMNSGAARASGEILVFLHADTHLPPNALVRIEEALKDPQILGGNFSLVFAGETWESRWLTRLYPLLRLGGMCYGDSAFFVRRAVFESIGGYREYPIFEDCDLYRRLRRQGKFVRVPAKASTSSRRFAGRFFRTFALWSLLQVLYWLGVSPHRLAKLYRPFR